MPKYRSVDDQVTIRPGANDMRPLEIDQEYIIWPYSHWAKDRGRRCILLDFVQFQEVDGSWGDMRVKVRYLDTGRIGWPDPGALVLEELIDPAELAEAEEKQRQARG